MDFVNCLEVFCELESDFKEGCDMMIVKFVLSYLDIVWDVKNYMNVLVVVYNVSGEYSMIKVVV